MRLILFILLTLSKCYAEKPSVTITLAPYEYAIKKIAHDELDIHTLIPEDVNPHIYDMKPQELKKLNESKVWFCSGESLEEKVTSGAIKKVNLNKDIHLISSCCHHHDHHHHSKDLHTWVSPKLYLEQSKLILEELCLAFPEKKDSFKANFKELEQELTALISKVDTFKQSGKKPIFIVSHAAYSYLAQDLSVKQISIEVDGKEAHLKHIQTLYNQFSKEAPKKIFAEIQHGDLGARRLASLLNAEVVLVNPYQKNYPLTISEILDNI